MGRVALSTKYDVGYHYDRLKHKAKKKGAVEKDFNVKNRSLENVLKQFMPDYQKDKDYLAIKRFQLAIQCAEEQRRGNCISKLKSLLCKVPVADKAKQGICLREMGLRVKDICEILQISETWYQNHCRPYINDINQGYDLETAVIGIENRLGQIA
jgi:hypothetical protein